MQLLTDVRTWDAKTLLVPGGGLKHPFIQLQGSSPLGRNSTEAVPPSLVVFAIGNLRFFLATSDWIICHDCRWESFSDVSSLQKQDEFIHHDAPTCSLLRSEYLGAHRGLCLPGLMLLCLAAYEAMASSQS